MQCSDVLTQTVVPSERMLYGLVLTKLKVGAGKGYFSSYFMEKKRCPRCKQEKLLKTEFNASGKYCLVCHAEKGREWRKANPAKNRKCQRDYLKTKLGDTAFREKFQEKEKRRKRKYWKKNGPRLLLRPDYQIRQERFFSERTARRLARRDAGREFILDFLTTHPCSDCGESRVLVLEFDHVRGVKTANVSELVDRGATLEVIKAEVEKCDVRCCNCHALKTATQFQTWKLKWIDKKSDSSKVVRTTGLAPA